MHHGRLRPRLLGKRRTVVEHHRFLQHGRKVPGLSQPAGHLGMGQTQDFQLGLNGQEIAFLGRALTVAAKSGSFE